jgi:hypothetical protein
MLAERPQRGNAEAATAKKLPAPVGERETGSTDMIPLSVDLFPKIDLRPRRPSSMTPGSPLVRVPAAGSGVRAGC